MQVHAYDVFGVCPLRPPINKHTPPRVQPGLTRDIKSVACIAKMLKVVHPGPKVGDVHPGPRRDRPAIVNSTRNCGSSAIRCVCVCFSLNTIALQKKIR